MDELEQLKLRRWCLLDLCGELRALEYPEDDSLRPFFDKVAAMIANQLENRAEILLQEIAMLEDAG